MTEIIFKNRKINIGKLLSFGFEKADNNYVYHTDLIDGQMRLTVKIDTDGKIYTKVMYWQRNERYNIMNLIIRSAAQTDAEQIGAVHYRAWIETYTDLLPAEYLAARSAEKSAAKFRTNGCRNLVVAEADSEIIGFCGWGEFRDTNVDDCMGEIQGIYLLNTFKRKHLGQRMMNFALEQLKSDGYCKSGLWVLASNKNAIRFYEKMGFSYNGIAKKVNLGEPITELLYIKDL